MTKILIDFTFSDIDNPMQLSAQGHPVIPDAFGKAMFIADIELPSKIILEVSGKNKNDTVVDAHGNIVKDKCIIIENVYVDGLSPNINFLKKWPRLMAGGKGSNKIVYSNYFGFNGIVELEFEGANVFQWLLRTNKFRDSNWNTTY